MGFQLAVSFRGAAQERYVGRVLLGNDQGQFDVVEFEERPSFIVIFNFALELRCVPFKRRAQIGNGDGHVVDGI